MAPNLLVINFAGDISLANNLYNNFKNKLMLSENIEIRVEDDSIKILLFEDQNKQIVKQIRRLIQEYLHSFTIYKDYRISQLENIFTVGIPKDIVEISNLVFCEICGYGMSTDEELMVHRRTHGIL